MKLLLKVRGRKEHTEVEAQPFRIVLKDGLFSVTTPMIDDWQRSADFDLRVAVAVIEAAWPGWVISFPDSETLARFIAWLIEADAKAKQGYRTMYP